MPTTTALPMSGARISPNPQAVPNSACCFLVTHFENLPTGGDAWDGNGDGLLGENLRNHQERRQRRGADVATGMFEHTLSPHADRRTPSFAIAT